MFVEKLDAIMLHKFIKENIDETVKSVDIRQTENTLPDKKICRIVCKTRNGLEPNFIIIDDLTFTISVSNHSESKILSTLSPQEITKRWQKFMKITFGLKYYELLKNKHQK